MKETRSAEPLTRDEIDTLSRYNAERSRGILHNDTWAIKMHDLQMRFDAEYKPYTRPYERAHETI